MATAQLSPLLRYIRRLAAGNGSMQRPDRQLLDDFSARRDEAAFAALVARHGPMVLRVCRRVLNHEQDAEDAFQATFLVLARSTGSIRKREALAAWLHGVAYRTAMEAKRKAGRRRNHETRLWQSMAKAAVSPSWDDVQAVLDEEIQRLPEAFRSAFVLCVLEGKSGPEAAAELGVKQGTVSSRVTRARQRLQQRLTRRGIKLAALLATLSVAESAQAAVTAALAEITIRSGLLVAAGGSAAGVIPSHVAALAAGVTRAMFLTKAKIAIGVLLGLGLITAAGALTHQVLAAQEKETPPSVIKKSNTSGPQVSDKAKPPKEAADSITYGGRVLDPDGKPVAGAKLYVALEYGFPHRAEQFPLDATTGADGRFKFTAPKGKYPGEVTSVGAMAANYGAGWVVLQEDSKRDDLTLQLVKDDVPIIGQIVDLEGKPVPGATLRLLEIRTAPGEDLGPWLEAVKAKKGSPRLLEWEYLTRYTISVSGKAATDADGRFRLTGIGRNRLVRVQLDGPTIASQLLHILTQPGAATEVARQEGNPEYNTPRIVTTYYGPNFRHATAPTKPIVGVVRDKDTNTPLAGVTIQSMNIANSPNFSFPIETVLRATTDAQGRYRLTGMPKGKGNTIVVVPPRDLPYVAINSEVPDTDGLEPVTLDLEMKRGIWIEGKITDKATGKPVRARVEYFAKSDNPNVRDYPGFEDTVSPQGIVAGKEDGSYRVAGLPGPGLIVVWRVDHYLRATDRDDEYGNRESPLAVIPFPLPTGNYCAVAPINPAKGVASAKRDVTLDLGWAFKVTVLGPNGKPLAGARIFDLGWAGEGMKTAEVTVRRFNPRQPRDILFQHLDLGLVGEMQPPKENGGSVTVKMQPGAAVTGRLLDADGQPRAGVDLALLFRTQGPSFAYGKTDREGRFRFGALLPKHDYQLSDRLGVMSVGSLRSGQTKDLGDVKIKPNGE